MNTTQEGNWVKCKGKGAKKYEENAGNTNYRGNEQDRSARRQRQLTS